MNIHKILLDELTNYVQEEYDKLVREAVSYADKNDVADRARYMTHKYCYNKLKDYQKVYIEKLDELRSLIREQEIQKMAEEEKAAKESVEQKAEDNVEKKTVAERLKDMSDSGELSLGSNLNKKTEAPKMTSTSEGPISPIESKPAPKKVHAKRGRPKKKK